MFFLGVLLVTSSIGVGVGALHYKFYFDSKVDNPDDWDTPLYEYQRLSDDEQRVVNQAINGKEFVFSSSEPIPGRGESSLGKQEMMVVYSDKEGYYIFEKQIIFVSTKPAGYTAITMAITGIALIGDAIRRHHFPHRNLFWQLR